MPISRRYAGGELGHPLRIEREDRVPEEDLAHPAARLPVRQLGDEVLDRAAPHRLLARILARGRCCTRRSCSGTDSRAATRRRTRARRPAPRRRSRACRPTASASRSCEQRPHRIADRPAVALEACSWRRRCAPKRPLSAHSIRSTSAPSPSPSTTASIDHSRIGALRRRRRRAARRRRSARRSDASPRARPRPTSDA